MKQIYRLYGTPPFIGCIMIRNALSLLLFTLLTATGFAQVNAYAKVTAITTSSGKSVLTLSNVNQTYHTFAAGEQVVVIQMQDSVIGTNTTNVATFGNLSAIRNAGFYDVATISTVTSTTMTLTDLLGATFTIGTNSSVQVVSFRKLSTGNFTTTANITAVPWSGTLGTGGVVAVQVPGTLTLKHNINADGQGFTGGAISANYEDECEPAVYMTNSINYAAKGEGIYVATNANYARGRGHLLNGGGGGSDDNGGGAGGGNYSAGGQGGPGYTCTGTDAAGGLGGIGFGTTYFSTGARLFMGGGGGGAQGNNGTQTAGANGGGIVIIKAAGLTTSCSSGTVRISANGNSSGSTTGSGADGAGGAGAAGTVLLQIGSFNVPASCPLAIQANGGGGGNVTNAVAHGGGGGGGQGALLFAGALPTSNTTNSTIPGLGGLNSSAGTTRANSGGGTNNQGVIGGIGSVLPVHLMYLSAENKNKKAVVNFTTANEWNSSFNVQHSTDGITFTTIGTVKGTGNSNTNTSYSFTDPNAVSGKNYYRLEMISDAPAKKDYSEIVSVNMAEVQTVNQAWPNPAHDYFSVRVNNENLNKDHVVTITDLTGKILYTNTYKAGNPIITVIPGKPLKPGLYMYKLACTGSEQTGKLIIQ